MPRRRRLVQSRRAYYPRERGALLAKHSLFPRMSPPMPESHVISAARAAFKKSSLTKSGEERDISSTPETLSKAALKHLKERTDPVDGVAFFSSVNVEDVFQFDAIFHEMHRHKMQMGDFYHQQTPSVGRISAMRSGAWSESLMRTRGGKDPICARLLSGIRFEAFSAAIETADISVRIGRDDLIRKTVKCGNRGLSFRI